MLLPARYGYPIDANARPTATHCCLLRKAYELKPDDVYLLTNFGGLLVEEGKYDEAREFFVRALAVDPSYPNAYYGLALLYFRAGDLTQALETLDELFAKASTQDIRTVPVYDEARRMYLEASKRLAEQSYNRLMEFIEARKADLEERTGFGIDIVEDNTLEFVSAVLQMAWKHNRDRRVIRYRRKVPAVTPHLAAHEPEHIAMEQEAREAGRNVVIGNWARPWNKKPRDMWRNRGTPEAPGNHPYTIWATEREGFEQVGCIYSAQGFEFDYVGVIFGSDLRWDPQSRSWVEDLQANRDRGFQQGLRRDRHLAVERLKHIYRVLSTRGMKGTYFYFLDNATRQYFERMAGGGI